MTNDKIQTLVEANKYKTNVSNITNQVYQLEYQRKYKQYFNSKYKH